MNLIRIRDFSSEELDLYVRLSEPQLYHYCEPLSGLFIAESPKIIERALAAGYEPVSFLLLLHCVQGQDIAYFAARMML